MHFFKMTMAFFLLMTTIKAFAGDESPKGNETLPYLLVSVAPDKFFVEKIAGNTAKVELMVPAGASSHSFEPTPKQMLRASHADIWFQIGEGFEPRATKALQGHNAKMQIVDLRQGVNLITNDPNGAHCHCCSKNTDCVDPHFWLSPREAKVQAATIAKALTERYPEHAELYRSRLNAFLIELDALDAECIALLKPLKERTIMVSHPAYAYFCRDYNLKQLSIEFEGKDPTPHQLTRVLNEARQAKIKKIFIQMQYNNKGARLVAKEIGAKVVMLDPYAENYMESIREIAKNFAEE